MDHYLQIAGVGVGGADAPMLEEYTTLGFLAAHTESVELQLLVTGVTYRHPGLLAKIVSTLDVLSGGRAALGIGAAWYEREHAAYGVPFPPLKERFERLEETLQIVHQMWSSDDGPYAGRHYQLAETICSPQPLRRPRPPIMVGALAKKTLRLLAQYADAGNLFAGPHSSPEAVAAKLDVLAAHCEREGTDYQRIRKSVLWAAPVDASSRGAGSSPSASRPMRPQASMKSTSCRGMATLWGSSRASARTWSRDWPTSVEPLREQRWAPGDSASPHARECQHWGLEKEGPMKIAVLGTGMAGRTLAARLFALGHEVTIGTRDPAGTMGRTEPDRMGNPRSRSGRPPTRRRGWPRSARRRHTASSSSTPRTAPPRCRPSS